MKTRITELLGCKYPIIQGGMAWVAEHTLASAVSNAGGVGLIAGGSAPIDYLREQIRLCKEKTDKPFGVNIMLMSPNAEDLAQLVIDEKVAVVTTGAGNPGKYIPAWKEAGIKVIPVIPSVALARRMEKAGADAVVAEGTESGGHIASEECQIHPTFKDLVIKAKDTDNIVTGRYTGHPCRSIKTKFAKQLANGEKDGTLTPEKFEELTLGALRRAVVDGNVDSGSFLCGAISGMVNEIKPCKDIIEEIMAGAEKLLSK